MAEPFWILLGLALGTGVGFALGHRRRVAGIPGDSARRQSVVVVEQSGQRTGLGPLVTEYADRERTRRAAPVPARAG